jgi:hypothetical protein
MKNVRVTGVRRKPRPRVRQVCAVSANRVNTFQETISGNGLLTRRQRGGYLYATPDRATVCRAGRNVSDNIHFARFGNWRDPDGEVVENAMPCRAAHQTGHRVTALVRARAVAASPLVTPAASVARR